MKEQAKIAILWLTLVVCLMLHFNYNISDHFCGIANNIDPTSTPTLQTMPLMMKTVLHIIPLLFLALVLFLTYQIVRIINAVAAIGYTLFHAAHFISQLSQEPVIWIQVALLAVTLGISILLAYTSWNWMKQA